MFNNLFHNKGIFIIPTRPQGRERNFHLMQDQNQRTALEFTRIQHTWNGYQQASQQVEETEMIPPPYTPPELTRTRPPEYQQNWYANRHDNILYQYPRQEWQQTDETDMAPPPPYTPPELTRTRPPEYQQNWYANRHDNILYQHPRQEWQQTEETEMVPPPYTPPELTRTQYPWNGYHQASQQIDTIDIANLLMAIHPEENTRETINYSSPREDELEDFCGLKGIIDDE